MFRRAVNHAWLYVLGKDQSYHELDYIGVPSNYADAEEQ